MIDISKFITIKNLEVSYNNGQIYAETKVENNFNLDVSYAFYLYLDNSVIQKSWYSESNSTVFDIKLIQGTFNIKCFMKLSGHDNIITFTSNKIEVLCNPAELTKSGISA